MNAQYKDTFAEIGLIDAEKKYLDGIGAQYESEVVYQNMIKELEDKGGHFLQYGRSITKTP